MNPDFRKVALIAATLGLLVSLFLALRPDDEEGPTPTTIAATTSAPVTTETATGPDLEFELRGGVPVGGVERVTVRPGPVTIRVVSDTAGELHVHGYDLTFPLEASGTQELEFEAAAPGIFEIELEGSHRLVAELEVRP